MSKPTLSLSLKARERKIAREKDNSEGIKEDDAWHFYARTTYIQTLYLEEQTRS